MSLFESERMEYREEIADLRAKLQAAEEALAADDQASHTIEWRSRAEAAEAENQRLQAEVARLRAIHNTYYNKPFADAVSEAARTATEAALRWAANDIQSHDHRVLIWDAWIRSGRKALLGEDGNA